MSVPTFWGYRRENGRIGCRNYVVILPLDDLSNAACEAVASHIQGTMALPHPYGRLQFGEDLQLHFDTLIGTGQNPNVAACIVIGIEPVWTKKIVDGIAQTGKPVAGFAIEGYGDLKTVEMASRKAQQFVQYATEMQRTECSFSDLWWSTKCGESDTTSGLASNPAVGNVVDKLVKMETTVYFGETSEITGAEELAMSRGATPEIGRQFYDTWKAYNDFIESTGADLLGSQPTKGNIAGGLTTIEEKALGNLQKIGKTTKYVGVLKPAESARGKGLWFMDSSSAAAEMITLVGAAGSIVHIFTTGQGNVIGNPIVPTIKTSANPKTVATMGEHIDVDISGILRREMTLDQAGDALIAMMVRTLNGRMTAAETLGHKEFVLTKLYRSA
jgi:(2R)-sulfolactate sulfo-lyase subunit beta